MALHWVMLQTLAGTKIQMSLGTYEGKCIIFQERMTVICNEILLHSEKAHRKTYKEWARRNGREQEEKVTV